LETGNLSLLKEVLFSLFAGIPYEWYRKNDLDRFEGYYASVVYAFFEGLGLEVRAKDYTNRGRIDLVISYGDKVYVLEFKVSVNDKEQRALDVLKEKGYGEKCRAKARELYLVGIDFDPMLRNISHFEWERVK